MQINTMGLVLRAVRVGEADQILTVLTPGNGVLSASARGSLRLKKQAVQCLRAFLLFRICHYTGPQNQFY